MARNTRFHPEYEPLRTQASLQLDNNRTHGPFAFLNPTQAHFRRLSIGGDGLARSDQDVKGTPDDPPLPSTDGAADQPAANVSYKWTARNNRKGRHKLLVKAAKADGSDTALLTPRSSTNWRTILQTSWKMIAYYPVWDVSWWVAYWFTWGSIVWVINAFFSFLPDLAPSTDFPNEVLSGGGITAFIGATIFEVGSLLLMLEAVNENREGCFGWAVEKRLSEHMDHVREKAAAERRMRPDMDNCTHHHSNKKNLVGKSAKGFDSPLPSSSSAVSSSSTSSSSGRVWVWWPSSYDLRTHYLHELGFIACSAQMFGASVFWISGFTALPGINNKLSSAALDGVYWAPQVLGGCGFVVSGTLFMLETQKHWWQPAPGVLGWHIGLFNLIGGLGFTLCPCFGFDTSSWAQYQASCSTFWASWAFLIGSVLQLYESLEKHPVEVEKS